MVFESLRRLVVAVIYIIGLGFSGLVGIIGPFAMDGFGQSIAFFILGILLALLTLAAVALVNWIFQN